MNPDLKYLIEAIADSVGTISFNTFAQEGAPLLASEREMIRLVDQAESVDSDELKVVEVREVDDE